ncbi:MAG: metal-dependent hydrolase [Candidatus Aenigmarchaeota archaeon]|nr:metal-dependent hydrolase [Candidatus Aenigmarchaeota archaeon]
MPLAVTHVLVPIIVFEILRDRSKWMQKMFSPKHTFLVGVAGLMPDMDMLLFTALNRLGIITETAIGHRIFLHNLWIPLGFLMFAALFGLVWPALMGRRNRKYRQGKSVAFAKVFLLLAVGWMFHLALDAVLTGEVMPFYPISDYLVNWNLTGALAAATGIEQLTMLVSLDALLLIGWLWHEQFAHKIRDYF